MRDVKRLEKCQERNTTINRTTEIHSDRETSSADPTNNTETVVITQHIENKSSTPERENIHHNDSRGSLGHASDEIMIHVHPDEELSALSGSEEFDDRGGSDRVD